LISFNYWLSLDILIDGDTYFWLFLFIFRLELCCNWILGDDIARDKLWLEVILGFDGIG
jgi:hypothetical protein